MKKIFEMTYEKLQNAREAYDRAGDDEACKQVARGNWEYALDRIRLLGCEAWRLWRFYEEAKERNNEYIDINEVVWDKDVKPMIDAMRKFGIEYFTFSSGWSSAVETAWLFTENGCTLEGFVEINGIGRRFDDSQEKKHGYLFKVN